MTFPIRTITDKKGISLSSSSRRPIDYQRRNIYCGMTTGWFAVSIILGTLDQRQEIGKANAFHIPLPTHRHFFRSMKSSTRRKGRQLGSEYYPFDHEDDDDDDHEVEDNENGFSFHYPPDHYPPPPPPPNFFQDRYDDDFYHNDFYYPSLEHMAMRDRYAPPPPPGTSFYEDTSSFVPAAGTPAEAALVGADCNLQHQKSSSSSSSSSSDTATTIPKTKPVKSIWQTSLPTLVQASALQTWAFDNPAIDRVQVLLKKGERHGNKRRRTLSRQGPVEGWGAQVDVWHGPDSTPQNLFIYLEDDDDDDDDDVDTDLVHGNDAGMGRNEKEDSSTDFSAIIQTPQGHNTIAIRNTASNNDLLACVEGEESPSATTSSPTDYHVDPYYDQQQQQQQKKKTRHYHAGDPTAPNYYPGRNTHTAASSDAKMNAATTETSSNSSPLQSVIERLLATTSPHRVDGCKSNKDTNDDNSNARTDIHTVSLASNIASVQVLLRTEYMRPLQARVELILHETKLNQDNDDNSPTRILKRTIVEVYSEDGEERPFFAVLDCPKKNKNNHKRQQQSSKQYSVSMRIVNLSGVEFPLFASVEPYVIDTNEQDAVEGNNNAGDRDDHVSNSSVDGNNNEEVDNLDWWEESVENSHFGGGSNYDLSSNSTILDAEIL